MSTEQELIRAFKVFDIDNSETIAISEFRYIMTNYGMKMDGEEVDEMIKDADLAKNGIINYVDFARLMKS